MESMNERLFHAITTRSLPLARRALMLGANANLIDPLYGLTALHHAAIKNEKDMINLLLEFGANIDERTSNGMTPLIIAAQRGNNIVIEVLIEAGSDINGRQNSGATALMEAALNGHVDTVKLLLQSGADAGARRLNGATALSIACQRGHIDVTRVLIESYDNTGVGDLRTGQTPLHVSLGNIEMLKLLLEESRAKVNCRNNFGRTPLMACCDIEIDNVVEVISLLLEYGANPTLVDNDGVAPLDLVEGDEDLTDILTTACDTWAKKVPTLTEMCVWQLQSMRIELDQVDEDNILQNLPFGIRNEYFANWGAQESWWTEEPGDEGDDVGGDEHVDSEHVSDGDTDEDVYFLSESDT